MPRIQITEENPFGLSVKQGLVIEDIVSCIRNGSPFNSIQSHAKFYNAKNKDTLAVISYENLHRPNFKQALQYALQYYEVSGKIVQCLSQGLDACQITGNGQIPDYRTRLEYIKEINKIAGLY